MRWCWQQDFRNRPSASQLSEILTNPSIPSLVDAVSLHNSNTITCACVCTVPIEILPPSDSEASESSSVLTSLSTPHAYVTRGDLQEELWLSTYDEKEEKAEVAVINFKGKARTVIQTDASILYHPLIVIFLSCSPVLPSVRLQDHGHVWSQLFHVAGHRCWENFHS